MLRLHYQLGLHIMLIHLWHLHLLFPSRNGIHLLSMPLWIAFWWLLRAWLLASVCRESGARLNALPLSSCGLRMDNQSVRVAVGLRLGAPLCHAHICRHCEVAVVEQATHGFSCRWSDGKQPRHAAINDIIHRSLASDKVSSHLEPNGLYHSWSDGKRPDGITLNPWENGKALIWDATFPKTFAPPHLEVAARRAGDVAVQAEPAKCLKYSSLESRYCFVSVAIKTSGVFGPKAFSFLHDLGSRLISVSMEPQARNYLFHCILIAVQRANAAAVMGTLNNNSDDLSCFLSRWFMVLFFLVLFHCFFHSPCFCVFVFFVVLFPFMSSFCHIYSCFCFCSLVLLSHNNNNNVFSCLSLSCFLLWCFLYCLVLVQQ